MHWSRVVSAGALWTVVYNVVWAFAWFGFMRDEWVDSTAGTGAPMPWTAEVWFLWVLFTVPVGIAIMAYAEGRTDSTRHSILASLAVWALLAAGMAYWCLQASLPIRIVALDTTVNLVGMVAAGFLAAWGLRMPES